MRQIIAFILLTATAAAQQQAFVGYEGARLYAEASYLADVVDTLARGDTVVTIEKQKKFVRVSVAGREGWILAANLTAKAPKVEPPTGAAAKSDTVNTDASKREGRKREASKRETSKRDAQPSTRPGEPATAVCAATTKSGKQCSRKATDGSSYCWQHGK